jgi:methionyl-tRNA synthetase
MDKAIYITTPIYYVNAEPHLGHAYTTIVCDVFARYHRLTGQNVRFQTGTDEHGDKIAQAAKDQGITPKKYADNISAKFQATWPPLGITNDHFIRTTNPEHVKQVQDILQEVYDRGDIYFAKYGGNYCVGCERFYTDKELVDGKCPDHETEPVWIEEENYFFKMSKYQDALREHIQNKPDFIRPERYKNEVLSFLSEPLEDLCISRPKKRLSWGIELPFDDRFVTYVWFDALINYITGLGGTKTDMYQEFWPVTQHFIAKDILKPHGIYWPTMLMAAKIPLYDHLNVHGYWNMGASKMSKSLGNVVAALDLSQVYGVDAFRYFLMREMKFGLDASFSEELLVERYNADLANDLGNLFFRVLNMLKRYRDGKVPPVLPSRQDHLENRFLVVKAAQQVMESMPQLQFQKALAAIWELVSEGNRYVVKNEPWALAKDPDKSRDLDDVLFNLTQLLGSISVMLWPVMPETAEVIAKSLDMPPIEMGMFKDVESICDLVPEGAQTSIPEPLFPRVDTDKVKAKAAKKDEKAKGKKKKKAKKKPEPGPGMISIDQFAEVKLRLGKILEAEKVPKSDKLMKMQVDLGEDKPRQIVAGIAQHYQAEELVGQQCVVVANLMPAKLMGNESQGMVLAAVSDDKVRIVSPKEELPVGSTVR